MSTEAVKGKACLDASNYVDAITHLTLALRHSQSPVWLIQRSTAYHRSKQYDLALTDAEDALLVATSRARRELKATAQFRRAVALHGMKRFGDARLCLNWCRMLNEKEAGLGVWQAKVKMDYERAEKEGDEVGCKCTVVEYPKREGDGDKETKPAVSVSAPTSTKKVETEGANPKIAPVTSTAISKPATPAPAPQMTPKDKIRHEWYQSQNKVDVTIFAKGYKGKEDQVKIVIQKTSIEVTLPCPNNETYTFNIPSTFSEINVQESEHRITPHKIELNLTKAVPALKWASLEGSSHIAESAPLPTESTKLSSPTLATVEPQPLAPSYPTSSRNGPKNWDAITKEDKEEESGNPDDFFKMLYKGADENARKAMMKSFQESNGTALSTNWDEVSKGPVKTVPPEGVEAKKWE